MFDFTDTKADITVSKEDILARVSEWEIMGLVFKPVPSEGQRITSPFRPDRNPGCMIRSYNGIPFFYDFADTRTVRDCWQCVADMYGTQTFNETLMLVWDTLIEGMNVPVTNPSGTHITGTERCTYKRFTVTTRVFNGNDRYFWSKYGISRRNLEDDNVYAVKSFSVNGSMATYPYRLCYCYGGFRSRHCKLYMPHNRTRFLGNCTADDIGNAGNTDRGAGTLVISKSYKDCRVLRNIGLQTIWFQNEGCKPSYDAIRAETDGFDRIVVFFDNDNAGMIKVVEVSEYIRRIHPNVISYTLPEQLLEKGIKDPSDMVKVRNSNELIKLLTENGIYRI